MIDAQQVADVRDMRQWTLPPHHPAAPTLDCDEEIREWLVDDRGSIFAYTAALERQASPIRTDKRKTLEERFREEAEKWDRETAHLSSPAQRFLHPSYVAIMGMAQDNRDKVIDLLLRDMRDNRREWFWALSYLTHQNPIDKRDSGKLDNMIQSWVRWGKQEGRL
jgi:hypothetical protein